MTVHSMSSAAGQLAEIAVTAPDHMAAQRESLEIVREHLAFDVAAFSTVDPPTLLWTSCVTQGMNADPRREMFLFENEYRQNDLHKVSDLAKWSRPVARLSNVDPEALQRSPRYRALQEMGAADELRLALVEDGNCWGSIELYRARQSRTFTENDERVALALGGELARMIRLSLLRHAAGHPGLIEDPPGVLVLNPDGDVEAMSSGCERWFEEIGTSGSVPPVVRALTARFGADAENLSTSVPGRSGGWLRIHATGLRTTEAGRTTIVIEPVKPPVLADSVVRAYGFTPREREVITCITRGLSSKEIAATLGISLYTVNDHVKSVLRKAGVQSRQQLIATLFFEACLPLRRGGATPGPYGWFLDA